MRSLLIPAAVAAFTLGSARPADAQVFVAGGYPVQQTYVYPASGYSGGFYSPGVNYGYSNYQTSNFGYSTFAAPYAGNVYNTYRYGGGNFNQGYRYGYGNRYSGVNGYRSSYGAFQGGRRWRR